MAAVGHFHRALITGASVGIGAAFAECLARRGCDVVLVARDERRLTELAQRLQDRYGVSATVRVADLTRRLDQHAVETAIAEDTALDLLVNNAGFGTLGGFAELNIDRETEEVELNVVALMRLTRAALPGMVARKRGAIVNVSSLAAFQPGPYNATYGATKAYGKSFSEALSEELRGTGVRVQALCPGFTRTEFQARAGLDASRIPSIAWMTPEQVVECSLAALGHGEVVCIPGLGNRAAAMFSGIVPRSLLRRIMGGLSRRTLPSVAR